ncbi:MAG TPA: hypothetical protein VIN10_09745 [Bacteroidales bacterium]
MPEFSSFTRSNFNFLIWKKILFILLIFVSFSLKSQVFYTDLEDSVFEKKWIGIQTIDSGFAHSGFHFSKVDSANIFGLGMESPFPAEVRGKNTWVKFSGWVKSETASDQLIFAFALLDSEQTYYWKGVQLAPLLVRENEWFQFADSVLVPAKLTEKAIIKAFLWNSDKKYTAGIDDLKFVFWQNKNPGFIPEIQTPTSLFSEDTKVLFQNPFYRILYDASSNSLSVFGKEKQLISQFSFYSKTIFKNDTIENLLNFRHLSNKKTQDGEQIKFAAANGEKTIELLIDCKQNSGELNFSIKNKLKKNTQVIRQAIIVDASQDIAEVYRANRKSDTTNFQAEYWLGQEGVRFGKGGNSLTTYHNPDISSLQLLTLKNQLWINLDYEKDHPFLHFPLNNDSTDWKLDWSTSKYEKKTIKTYKFSFFVGSKKESLPRFMKNPNGLLATYIWTEHADYTDIRTNRATYFGSEKITNADSATGGFVKFQIPVTKSIFYNNVNKISNDKISANTFQSQLSSFLENKEFQDFLFQLKSNNIEICLHTPEQFTTTFSQLEEALSGTKEHFQSVSWIDHGYNNHLENNREDLVCDGTLPASQYYAADLWKKYGVKYFWNSYYEDYFTFAGWGFYSSFEKPYSGFGDFFPNPDFWANQRTPGILHWPTKNVLYIENDALWEYNFSENKLNNFVEDWAVEINHCYPAWVNPAKGFWVYGEDSTIVAAHGFNRTLERMAKLRDEGLLNVSTVKDFMDYQLAVQSVSYQIQTDGRIKITNNGFSEINSLAFATKGKAVRVNGFRPDQKLVDGEIVFWFDLLPGESKIIRVIN